jgi:mannose-6-phosphate isomerase class I
LRFYDWLRRNGDGELRPVHVEHAFRNLDGDRRGAAVQRDLVPCPRALRHGEGWDEVVLGELAEMFFEVRRLEINAGTTAQDATTSSFHVLNVVEGDGVLVEPAYGDAHSLVYAETMVVPASVGPYRLRPLGPRSVKIVKALVR